MIKKLIKNFKLTIVLFLLTCIVLWATDGIESVKSMVIEYGWAWILLPFFLRIYNWFTNLKQKAFDYGADTSGAQAERKASRKDMESNATKKQYEELLSKTQYSKSEALELRNRNNYESLALQKSLSETNNAYTIALHRYVSGLPGPNLLRPSELKQQFTVAQISNGKLEFYNSDAASFEKGGPLDSKFSDIPLASIIKLEVVDLAEGRQLKRVGADLGRKMAQTVVSAASQTGGARVAKFNVDAAQLIIHYVNEDGIVFPATFVFNSNSKLGAKAMENLRLLNKTLNNFSFLGRITWNKIGTHLETDMKNDYDFDVSEITSLAGDTIKVLKWANMLSPHDSAVVTAKLSAEMIGGVLQDTSIPLIETIQ